MNYVISNMNIPHCLSPFNQLKIATTFIPKTSRRPQQPKAKWENSQLEVVTRSFAINSWPKISYRRSTNLGPPMNGWSSAESWDIPPEVERNQSTRKTITMCNFCVSSRHFRGSTRGLDREDRERSFTSYCNTTFENLAVSACSFRPLQLRDQIREAFIKFLRPFWSGTPTRFSPPFLGAL